MTQIIVKKKKAKEKTLIWKWKNWITPRSRKHVRWDTSFVIPLSLSDYVAFISAVILGCKVVFEVWYESLLLFLLFLTAGKERQRKTKNQKTPKYVYWFGISFLIFLFIINFIIIEVTLTCSHRAGYKGQFKDNQSYLKHPDGSQTVSACNYTNASSYNLPSSDSEDGIFMSRFQAVGEITWRAYGGRPPWNWVHM